MEGGSEREILPSLSGKPLANSLDDVRSAGGSLQMSIIDGVSESESSSDRVGRGGGSGNFAVESDVDALVIYRQSLNLGLTSQEFLFFRGVVKIDLRHDDTGFVRSRSPHSDCSEKSCAHNGLFVTFVLLSTGVSLNADRPHPDHSGQMFSIFSGLGDSRHHINLIEVERVNRTIVWLTRVVNRRLDVNVLP